MKGAAHSRAGLLVRMVQVQALGLFKQELDYVMGNWLSYSSRIQKAEGISIKHLVTSGDLVGQRFHKVINC